MFINSILAFYLQINHSRWPFSLIPCFVLRFLPFATYLLENKWNTWMKNLKKKNEKSRSFILILEILSDFLFVPVLLNVVDTPLKKVTLQWEMLLRRLMEIIRGVRSVTQRKLRTLQYGKAVTERGQRGEQRSIKLWISAEKVNRVVTCFFQCKN